VFHETSRRDGPKLKRHENSDADRRAILAPKLSRIELLTLRFLIVLLAAIGAYAIARAVAVWNRHYGNNNHIEAIFERVMKSSPIPRRHLPNDVPRRSIPPSCNPKDCVSQFLLFPTDASPVASSLPTQETQEFSMYAEQALAESEKRFRALVTASSDVVYRMSADFSELRQLEGHLFVAASRAPNRNWLEEYIHPDDRELARAAIGDAVARKGILELECRVFLADGSVGWTHTRAVPMLDGAGGITEWIGMVTNVTARKNAEQALANQRRMYEAILTNTPDLAYVWNLEHRFIYANEGLLRMWGRTWEEAIGKNCLELGYEPWHAAMHDREIEQVVATKLPVRGEVPFNGTFGRRTYDYLLVPVIGASGEVEAVAGTTRDVTERKQLEGSLIEADRRKDEFLATLAHELRNPLAPIRNAVHLLKVGSPTGESLRAAREIIDRQVHHMVRLVDDLMDVSRITLGQVNLRNERVALRRVIDDAVEAAAPAIEAGNHRLVVDVPGAPLFLEGDGTRLSQVFQNLLDNAAKYTPPEGTITLRAEVRGDRIAVSVRDNGIGISPEATARVFELFTRVHPSDRIKTSGLGIGLALAKKLIELHLGEIEVRSEGAGLGSEFIVTLPAAVAAQTPKLVGDNGGSRALGARRRVMVVDDNRDAAESLGMLLEMENCTVSVAFDGLQALAALEQFQPDIVLLDIGMPGMDGYELARRMRATSWGGDLVLVALTGWGQADDKKRAMDAGFNEHLTKPVDPDLLARVVTFGHSAAA
jgi:PAS domain S-box-containing protein